LFWLGKASIFGKKMAFLGITISGYERIPLKFTDFGWIYQMQAQKFRSAKEASIRYNIPLKTLYKYKDDIGYIKKKGLGIRFRDEDIESWLKGGYHKSALSEVLPKFDISLDGCKGYDKLFLIRRKELNGIIRWTYPIGSILQRKTKRKEAKYYIHFHKI